MLYIAGWDKLEMLWQNEHGSADSFCKLKEVQVSKCSNLVKMFPSSMRTRLGNLRELDVRSCEKLQEVFEIQIISININDGDEEVKCHKLDRVNASVDRELDVRSCPCLKSIFPGASVAKDLSGLQKLNINDCGIEEIVGKEEGLETVGYEFEFPLLEVMMVLRLPNLASFCGGPHSSRFPLLTDLEVNDCPKMEGLLASELLSSQGTPGSLFFTNNVRFSI